MKASSKRSARGRGSRGAKIAGLSVAALLVLLAVLWGITSRTGGPMIFSSAVGAATRADVVDQVRVDGTVQPAKVQSLFTSLTGAISSVDVAVGDRVSAGQQVASIDTQATQRELDAARIQQGGLVATSQSQAETARVQYQNFKDQLDRGANPEVSAAATALKQAQDQAREAPDGAAAQAVRDAEAALATAREGAQNQLKTLESAYNEAVNAERGAQATSDQTIGQLQSNVESGRLTAPFSGVVMSVAAQVGAQPTGALLTVGDDSSLKVKTVVRESDVAKLKEGQDVTFTAGSAGSRQYTGVVSSVSQIAQDAAPAENTTGQEAAAQASAQKPGFAVEIDVVGDTHGLYLGSSVRANIIADQVKDTLAVPLDAVFAKNSGEKYVLVLKRQGDTGIIEERRVETGLRNDVSVAVTGGDLKENENVISQPADYRNHVGAEVTVTEQQEK